MWLRTVFSELELRRDPGIVQATGDAIQDLDFPACELAEASAVLGGGRRREERAQLGEEPGERRLPLEQHVVRGVERYQPGAGDEAREDAPLLERHAKVALGVQQQRRAAHARGRLAHVDVEQAVDQPREHRMRH
jgi:hypothetical protein